jgi:hypothetical protein
MFQSGQLSSYQNDTLASLVILLVALSLGYFAWVVFGELWVSFYPETPISWLGIKPASDLDLFESKLPRDSISAITFENQNPMALPTEEDDATDEAYLGSSAIVIHGDDEDEQREYAKQRVISQLQQDNRSQKEKSGSMTRMLSLPQMIGGKQPKLKKGYSDLVDEGQAGLEDDSQY